jgi:hypothetical protein
MPASSFAPENCVFINCPFDEEYFQNYFFVVMFTITYCGFRPRCARESYGAALREDAISERLEECSLGFHDVTTRWVEIELPRTGLFSFYLKKPVVRMPRYNMAYELGRFLELKLSAIARAARATSAAIDQRASADELKRLHNDEEATKRRAKLQTLIVTQSTVDEVDKCFSDIKGRGIVHYEGKRHKLIGELRSWLQEVLRLRRTNPNDPILKCELAEAIEKDYTDWHKKFVTDIAKINRKPADISFDDVHRLMIEFIDARISSRLGAAA